jgi:hypothetical protein
MGLYTRGWGQQALAYAIEGPALKELQKESAEALFLPGEPAFAASIPDALAPRSRERVNPRWNRLDYAQACAALSRLLRVPVVADYYTFSSSANLNLAGSGITISQVFTAFHRAFDCHFAWRQGMLLVRRGDWPRLDRREISEKILMQCLAWKRRGSGFASFQTRELSFLAATLRREQLPCLNSFSSREDKDLTLNLEARIIHNEYEVLRLVGSLNRSVQDRILSQGLNWTDVYRSAPVPYLELFRKRTPWLLNNPEVSAGIIRLAAASPGSYQAGFTATPDDLPPMNLELRYRVGNKWQHYVETTTIPWKASADPPAGRR